jgi:cell division septation protein DedD
MASVLLLSACAEAHLGVALAKRANATLSGNGAPSAAQPATTGPGAAPARAAQLPADKPRAADDLALAGGAEGGADRPPMIRDAALFFAEAQTLWDGLPSMGGVWAAHPGIGRSMVVEAVNLDTGRSMRLPALRLNQRPGRPVIQLSAEAALALGMAPGRLTMVRLTGLRAKPASPAPGAVETFVIAAPAPAPAIRPDIAATAATGVVPPADAPPRDAGTLAALSPGNAPTPAQRPATRVAMVPSSAAPYVQVGAFSQPSNAGTAAALLRARGLTVVQIPAGRLSRVLLGPFDDMFAARRARDLAVQIGFADAYLTVQ